MARTISPTKSEFSGKVTLIDMHSLRAAAEFFSGSEERVPIDFAKLKESLEDLRNVTKRWVPSELSVALASIDTNSEAQNRLADALDKQFDVDTSYYRDNFVSMPPGRSPAEIFDKERGARPLISLAPNGFSASDG